MTTQIKLRPQRVTDAKRFFEILSNPKFIYFYSIPKTLQDEIDDLKGNAKRRKENIEHNFTILCDGKVVGGAGMKIRQENDFIGEIGYFIAEESWGKGIATKAVKLLEKIGFTKLKLKRIEAIMDTRHIGSEKVAIKAGYNKEGIMKSAIRNGKRYYDGLLYAKIKK